MQFPASAASSLIEGYCGDFVSLAAVLAQTLEQVSIRGIDIRASRAALERTERGMRQLADAIQELVAGLDSQPPAAAPTSNPYELADDDLAIPPTALRTAPAASPERPKSAPAAPANAPESTAAAEANRGTKKSSLRVDMRPPELPPTPTPAPVATSPTPTPPATPTPTPTPPPAPTPSTSSTGSIRTTAVAPANRPRPATGPIQRPATAANPSPTAPPRPGQRREAAKPEGIKGNSQSMPMLSVFQFLGRMRKVGTMKVTLPGEQILFELENGCISFTSTDQCPREERLGELLIEADACSRAQVDMVLAKVDAGSTELFGQLAIHESIVTKEQVVAALEEQVRRRFTRACRNPDATYEFLQDVRSSIEHRFRIQPVAVG